MRRELKVFSALGFGIALIIIGAVFLYFYFAKESGLVSKPEEYSCATRETMLIRGFSMYPLLNNGEEVEALRDYYDCNEPKRGQAAIITFTTREEEFIKKIAAVGGDKLEFDDNNALVNGEILKNSADENYRFSQASIDRLSTPLDNDKIPMGRYMALGDSIGYNSFDSRQFGFISREFLKGRVLIDAE